MKKHERVYTERNDMSCMVCDFKASNEEDLIQHEKKHTCPHYKRARCMFGPKGENDKGTCRYSHPRRCLYDQTVGCKKTDCNFFHVEKDMTRNSDARPAMRSFNRGGQGKGPANNMAFLGQSEMFKLFDLYLSQKGQDLNNNGRRRFPQKSKSWN